MSDNPSATVADKIEAINAELKRNPPAFPMTGEGCHDARYSQPGMTLRDAFALSIAGGMAAHSGTEGGNYGPGEIANRSYQVADALLAARTGDA